LKIVDTQYNADLPIYPDRLKEAFPITHPSQILAETEHPAVPPSEIFGAEPAHTWCYYYQKADLARQYQDWQTIVNVGEEAFGQKYYPEELSELYPFVEGYARTGNWPRALVLIKDVKILGNPNLMRHSCTLLKRLYEESPIAQPDVQADFNQTWYENLQCLDYFPDYQP
jgi:hypothetical protein